MASLYEIEAGGALASASPENIRTRADEEHAVPRSTSFLRHL